MDSAHFGNLLTTENLNGISALSLGDKAAKEKILVVSATEFLGNARLAQFIDMKKSAGYDVELVNIADAGTDATALRNFIRTRYLASTAQVALSYLILVGDVEQVPSWYSGREFTDNYFAAVDKADYSADEMYPDIAVGRLTAKNNQELDVILGKLLRYQQAQFTETDWIKKIAFLATNDRYQVAEGTHNYVIDNYSKSRGYTGIFPTATEQGGDKLYAITHRANESDVVKSMNDGRVIISYSGHGAETFWDAPRVTMDDVRQLPASSALPYVMSHACVSGSYGMSDGDSFGEVWLKEANGAIGFFGTSNSSYWDEDDILEKRFFDGLYKMNVKTVGMLNQFGLAGVRQDFGDGESAPYYYRIYNLLGDPTLQLFKENQRPIVSLHISLQASSSGCKNS